MIKPMKAYGNMIWEPVEDIKNHEPGWSRHEPAYGQCMRVGLEQLFEPALHHLAFSLGPYIPLYPIHVKPRLSPTKEING